MEMERINDNTIRVMIENNDLKERGISIMELLGNHDKIESFFYSILSEVDVDHDFSDDDQVTFQILPNKNGLELFISRLNEDEQVGDVINNLMSYAKNKQDSVDDVSEERRSQLQQSDDGEAHPMIADKQTEPVSNILTLKLPNFETIITISQLLRGVTVESDLYRYDKIFYLTLRFRNDDLTSDMLADYKAQVIEFAEESNQDMDVLREHAEIVFQDNALEEINRIF